MKGFISRRYYGLLRKKVRMLMKNSQKVVTICDSLGRAYTEEFGCSTVTIVTGSNIEISSEMNVTDEKVFRYFGNLQLGRDESLFSIGKALDCVNQKFNFGYVLEIYTNETQQEILSRLTKVPSIRLKGFVSGEEVHRLMRGANFLIHTESFQKENIERVKYSVSTKIADSLASGTCLLAYGPAEVASIEYLIENEAAFCATSEDELASVLTELLTNEEKRELTVKNALALAKKNHDSEANCRMIKETLEEGCRE